MLTKDIPTAIVTILPILSFSIIFFIEAARITVENVVRIAAYYII